MDRISSPEELDQKTRILEDEFTEHKQLHQVEESIRESEKRLRTLVQAAPIIILFLSPDYRILECQPITG